VGSKALVVGALSSRLYDVPDCLGGDPIAPDLAQPIYAPEDRAAVNAGRRGPFIDGPFSPDRNWNSANVLSLSSQRLPTALHESGNLCSECN
jgi:hypothetical protein